MLSWEEALRRVLQHCPSLPAELIAAGDAVGRVLAEDVASDIDSPPYDKALVDGFAIRSEDVRPESLPVELRILETITAGQTPSQPLSAGQATRIMTGALLPSGADAVVMVEQAEVGDDGRVVLRQAVVAEQGVMRQGLSMRRDELVLRQGRLLRGVDIGLLAEVGRVTIQVRPAPRCRS